MDEPGPAAVAQAAVTQAAVAQAAVTQAAVWTEEDAVEFSPETVRPYPKAGPRKKLIRL